jgi:hypothetical protein
LYTDIDLADKEKTAMALYREGRYAEAHELFTVVAREQPENQAARFYQYYTRFLMNRLNREAYGEIRSGLAQLERNGYSRAEFREVLDFIDQEEQGYAGE